MTDRPWQPSAMIETLHDRARVMRLVRAFFEARGVLEVDVPLLSQGVALDPGLAAFEVNTAPHQPRYFLQTSPEFAMKRLLAAGSGPIFYLGKAFRKGEAGHQHNPEFTMLEWYQPGYSPNQLIDETAALLSMVLQTRTPERTTYAALFEQTFALNPHEATTAQLQAIAHQQAYAVPDGALDQSAWLDLLFSHSIEPLLGQTAPTIVEDFPACQAAMAQIAHDEAGHPVAKRFEFYCQGHEIANGYLELTDVAVQRARFEADLDARKNQALTHSLPVDEAFLAALAHGLPPCCGIALGFDRLMMLASQQASIQAVLPFDFSRA